VVKRGQVYWAKLDSGGGHEQAGMRPVLVASDDRYNAKMKLAVVIPLTSREKWQPPLQVNAGLVGGKRAWALPGQIRTLSVKRLVSAKEFKEVPPTVVEACLEAVREICGETLATKADNDG
jgi:mRNA interferase MazF